MKLIKQDKNNSSLSSLDERSKTRKSINNDCHIAQSGHSMTEMLTALAIMGILGITSVLGIKYLIDKNTTNQIIEDVHLAYISTHTSECIKDFKRVDFQPTSDKQTDVYCDAKQEKYIRVSDISDSVCKLILNTTWDDFKIYSYDEYTYPTCDKESNDLIFAIGDVGFPAIACNNIDDCPANFDGICHKTDKICLECPLTHMPNETYDMCIEVTCDEKTQTLCKTENAKWCCPNTELCSTTYKQCIQSDGMCAYDLIALPTTSKEAECAYKFVGVATTSKAAECAYELIKETREDGTQTMGVKIIKGCADSSHYCNVTYVDDICTSNAPADAPVGTTLYGSCSPMGTSYTGCAVTTHMPDQMMKIIKGCANSSHYCNVMYVNDICTSNAPANAPVGTTLYGSCSPMGASYTGCSITTHMPDQMVHAEKPCPSSQYCHLKYSDANCTTAPADIMGMIYGVCLPFDSSNAVCPVPQQ